MDIRKERNHIWTMITALISAVLVSVIGVIVAGVSTSNNNERINQQQINNNRQWCELLTPLDSAYSSTPPATELGKRVAEAIHRLHKNFGCGEED